MATGKVRGFKVTNPRRTKMIGIAASSLDELLTKSCNKFEIKKNKANLVLLDGTILDSDDYFDTIPDQTVIMIQTAGQYKMAGAELIYNTLKLVNIDVLRSGEAVEKFFDHNLKEKLRQLNKIVNAVDGDDKRILLSSRDEDPDWFTGLETNAKNKENFMFRRSQERIKSYLYKSRSDIRKSNQYENEHGIRETIETIFNEFNQMLKKDEYLGCYFDRSKETSLCDNDGEFLCRGAWNQKNCIRLNLHRINPYQSREARIVFSTWNLDHWIERSRSIIPSIMEASSILVTSQKSISIFNYQYFYTLLFTTKNLKLVHIVCHDKGEHKNAKCDKSKYFIENDKEKLESSNCDKSKYFIENGKKHMSVKCDKSKKIIGKKIKRLIK